MVVAILVLGFTWKIAKNIFKVVLVVVIAIAIYGFATGALTSAASPMDFFNKSYDNSKGRVMQGVTEFKDTAQDKAEESVKGTYDTVFGK